MTVTGELLVFLSLKNLLRSSTQSNNKEKKITKATGIKAE